MRQKTKKWGLLTAAVLLSLSSVAMPHPARAATSVSGAGTATTFNLSGATASGANSTAVGDSSKASAAGATAVGGTAAASAANSTAVGYSATAQAASSTAIGYKATVSGTSSYAGIAIGGEYVTGSTTYAAAKVTGAYGVAIGTASAAAASAVAIGFSSSASLSGSMALGYSASASDVYSLAVGYQSAASADYSSAVGYQSSATGNYAAAFGGGKAYEIYSTALGRGAIVGVADSKQVQGFGGIAIGSKTDTGYVSGKDIQKYYYAEAAPSVTADYGIGIGTGSVVTGDSGVALGHRAQASGTYATALGFYATASGTYAAALGGGKAYTNSSTAIGYNATVGKSGTPAADGVAGIAIGGWYSSTDVAASVTGDYGIAIGTRSSASNTQATALGYCARATNTYATAVGTSASAGNTYATAVGTSASAAGAYASAFGNGASASGENGTAIGRIASAVTGTALGYSAYAYGTKAIAVGDANAYKNYSIAIGDAAAAGTSTSSSSGIGGVAIGSQVVTTVDTTTTTEAGASVTADYGVAIGTKSSASGKYGAAVGYKARASSTNAAAFGMNSSASSYSTALGADSTATSYATAVGDGTKASGVSSTVIGYKANTTQAAAIAIGGEYVYNSSTTYAAATVSSTYGIAIGTASSASSYAEALGFGATASGSSVAIGYNSSSAGSAVAVGYTASAARGAVATGYNATASGTSSSALAGNAKAYTHYSTAIGYQATVGTNGTPDSGGVAGIAIGSYSSNGNAAAKVTGDHGIAIGTNAEATATRATALGYDATASQTYTLAIGDTTRASATNASALGYGANASGSYSTALGYNAAASGTNAAALGGKAYTNSSTAIGYNATVGTSGTPASGGLAGIAIGSQVVENSTTNAAAVATGNYGIAIGTKSSATGNYASVLGYGATASTNATALGPTASAAYEKATAVGYNARATGTYGTAVGQNASAVASSSALGTSATASGGSSLAAGSGSVASGSIASAMGTSSKAYTNYSTAIGYQATVGTSGTPASGGLGGIAIGSQVVDGSNTYDPAKVTGNYGIAIGTKSLASGTYASTLGYGTSATAYATAVGSTATATQNYSTSLGYSADATAGSALAAGYNASASGSAAAAIGASANASGSSALAAGSSSTASGTDATALGTSSKAYTNYSTAIGYGATAGTSSSTTANGLGAIAIGSQVVENSTTNAAAVATGNYGIAFGTKTSVTSAATKGMALGYGATVSTASGVAIGDTANVGHASAVAIGANSATKEANSVSVGASVNSTRTITNVTAGDSTKDAAIWDQISKTAQTIKLTTTDNKLLANDNTVLATYTKMASVASTDTGFVSGADLYNETRNDIASTYYIAKTATAGANLSALDKKIGQAKTANTALYAATDDVETQISKVAAKTVQSVTDATSGTSASAASKLQTSTLTMYDGTTKTISVAGEGAVASGDVRLLNGNTAYTELRPVSSTNYLSQTNTTAANLSALDKKIGQAKTASTALYAATDDVETQISKVAGKAVQSVTNATAGGNASKVQTSTLTMYDGTAKTIEVAGEGAVASGDLRLVNGNTVYLSSVKKDQTFTVSVGDTADIKNNNNESLAAITYKAMTSVAATDTGFVSGGSLYNEVRKDISGTSIVSANATTGANLKALEQNLVKNQNYTVKNGTLTVYNNKYTGGTASADQIAFTVSGIEGGSGSSIVDYDANYGSTSGDHWLSTDFGNTVNHGDDSTAYGYLANAQGAYSTALGYSALAQGRGSISLGDSQASSEYAIAAGTNAAATGMASIAIGGRGDTSEDLGAKAQQEFSLAIGVGAKSTAERGVAIGYLTEATGRNATAVGKSATASGKSSVAFGEDVSSEADASVAIGNEAIVAATASGKDASNSIAIGAQAWVLDAKNATAIGSGSVALEDNTVSVGSAGGTITVGDETVELEAITRRIVNVANGTKNTDAATYGQLVNAQKQTDGTYKVYEAGDDGIVTVTTNEGDTAFKIKAAGKTYTGSDTITISDTNQISVTNMAMSTTGADLGATAGGAYSFAIGGSSNASGSNSVALGYKAVAGYTASTETLEGATVAIGATASATGNGSTALGYGAQTTGNDAVSVGSNSYATAKDSIALGSEAGAQGQASMALGADSWAAGESAVALGHQSYANGAQSLAFGFYSQTGLAIPVYNEDQTEITGYNYVGGKNSQAIGDNSRAYGNNSVAIGGAAIAGYYTYNQASQSYSSIDGGTAVGYGAQALADLSSAFGIGSKSLGAGTLAIGANSIAAASTMAGSSYKADYSTAMGYTAQTWAGYSTAIGYQAATKFQTDDLVTDTATNTKTATVSFGHQAGDYYAEAKTDSAGNVTYEIKAYGDNVLSRLTNVAYGSAKNEAAAWGQIAANYVEGTTNDIVINTANPSGEIKANDGTTLAKITVTGDGVIEKNNTGLISGGTAYDYLSPAANGSYIKTGGTDGYTTAENLTALDKAIGKVETKGNYISAQNGTTVNVAKNLQELDKALYENSRIVRVSDDDKTQILVGNGTQYANVTTINVGNNGTTRKITGVTYGEATNDAAAYGQILAADQKIQLGMKDGNMTLKANDKTTLATFSITEANVLANDQGIVTGNVAYNELRKDVTGNYVDGDFNTGKNLSALDQAIGQTTQGKYISAQNGKTVNVATNLTELDTALYDQSKLVRIGGDNNDKILIGRNKDGTEFDAIQTIDVSNGSNRTIMGVAAGTKTGEAATWEQLASNNNGTAYEMGTDGVITVKTNGNTDAFKLKISVSGIIDDGDTGLITGATAYDELRKNVNGEYIDAGNDTGTNLSNLDAEIVNLNKKISDGLYTGSDTITISDTNQISVTNMAMSTTGANLGATAGGAYSFAIGGGANASGAQSVALGYKAVASGTASEETLVGATVAIGATASATGNGSTALGYGASTKGNDAAALGSFAQADAKDSAAIGSNAHAYNTGAMAFGAESIAYGEGAAAFGYESKALGARSLAFGQNAKAGLYVDGQGYYGGGDDSIAIGGQSMAHGNYSVAIGYAAAAGGYDASAYVFYKGATAIGLGAGAFHEGATAIGDGSRALGEGSTAIGLNTYANAEFSTTHGFQAQALGKESMALGYQAVASQDLVTEDGNKVATVSFGHQSGDKYYKANTSGGYDENSYNDVVLSRLTNVADGKANTDAATYGQLVKYQEYVFNADGVATIETNSSTEENKKVAFTLKLENGKIADSDEGNGYVTGKKIYEELRPTDGKYVKKDNTTAANLNALDAQVKLNYDDITQLKDLSNITTAGEKVIRDLSKNAVKLEAGDNISIKDSEDADGNKTYVISADLENSAELAAKANLDASNIGSNLKGADGTSAATEAEKKANLDAWGNALGTGTVTGDSVQLITGKTLYNEVRPSSGTYISAGNTTGENLVNLDKQVLANTTAISNLSTRVDGIENNIDSKIDSKIDGKVDGITLENKVYTFSKDNAQQAITYKDGTSTAFTIKIDGLGEGGTGTTYKAGNGIAIDTSSETPTISVKVAGDDLTVSESGLAVKKDGKVESGNTGLVTGGTVYDALQTMDNQVAQLSNDINQVGAGAAALAALRPEAFDPDDKWSFAVGYGHYKNANASALGVFFKPNADTTISLGGTLGNGDSMMNAGLSFKIGKRGKGAGLYRSNVELVREVSSLREDSTALKENDRIQKQMLNAQGERIAALEAENARMRQQIEAILSKVELSDTVTRSAVR